MGHVYKSTRTEPIPKGATITTQRGKTFARWKGRGGRTRSAVVITDSKGRKRIRTEAATYTAEYRDGDGIVRRKATGCRDKEAARAIQT